jgi:hypothetical protein
VPSGDKQLSALWARVPRWLKWTAATLILLGVLYAALTAEKTMRGPLVAAVAAVGAAAIAARYTWRAAKGQIADRYDKAIDQLGSSDHVVRTGGIYALQHVAIDNGNYADTVKAILEAFIQQHSNERWASPSTGTDATSRHIDVQAAFTVRDNLQER